MKSQHPLVFFEFFFSKVYNVYVENPVVFTAVSLVFFDNFPSVDFNQNFAFARKLGVVTGFFR